MPLDINLPLLLFCRSVALSLCACAAAACTVLCVGKGEYTVCFLCPRIERRTLVFFSFFFLGGGEAGFVKEGDTRDTERGPCCKPYHARQRDRGKRRKRSKGKLPVSRVFFCAVLLDFPLDKSRLWEKFGSFSFPLYSILYCTVRGQYPLSPTFSCLSFEAFTSYCARQFATYCILFHTVDRRNTLLQDALSPFSPSLPSFLRRRIGSDRCIDRSPSPFPTQAVASGLGTDKRERQDGWVFLQKKRRCTYLCRVLGYSKRTFRLGELEPRSGKKGWPRTQERSL